MQLLLALDDRTRTLDEVHRRLERRFGPQGPFYLLDPVSQLVMGLVGGRTHAKISRSAFEALLRRFGGWEAVRDAPVGEIETIIAAVTYADAKARRLKATLEAITRAHGRLTLDSLERLTVAEAIIWLERLPGVGRKVAAATLNFSSLRKPALVIDTHHLRILRSLALVGPKAGFRHAYDAMMALLPADWSAADLDEHHQLMKRLGQTFCRPVVPCCRHCPLRGLCPTATADLDQRRADQDRSPHVLGHGARARGAVWPQFAATGS